MRLLKRAFWFAVASVFLFEAWLWDFFQPWAQRLAAILPLRRLKVFLRWAVGRLPAWAALVVMGLPSIVLIPAKVAGLWLFAQGSFIAGTALFVLAKSVGVALVVFLFEICRPRLMELGWFARVYQWVQSARAWAHRQTEPARALIGQWKRRVLGSNPTLARRIAVLRGWSRRGPGSERQMDRHRRK